MDLVCDASSIITLSTNCLLWLLPPLKKSMKGQFFIAPSVKKELIDVPLKTARYKFEALRVISAIENNSLTVFEDTDALKRIYRDADRLLSWANSAFMTRKKKNLTLLHIGEAQTISLAKYLKCDVILIDEKTTRLLIEAPDELKKIIEKRSKSQIKVNNKSLQNFLNYTKDLKIIRSAELVIVAYEQGLFSKYLYSSKLGYSLEKELIEGILFAIKNSGCAITVQEITEYSDMETGDEIYEIPKNL